MPPGGRFDLDRQADGLRLRGSLNLASARAAFKALNAALPAGGSLAVDLSSLRNNDSAGLATLIEWRTEAARRGVCLRFSAVPDDLQALARLADLDAELFG